MLLYDWVLFRVYTDSVFLAVARHVVTGHTVAMKYISKRLITMQNIKTRVFREVDYMRTLRHPHIIKLYEPFAALANLRLSCFPLLFYQIRSHQHGHGYYFGARVCRWRAVLSHLGYWQA
jgi:hypothetical protein